MSGFKEVLFVADECENSSSVDCFDLQIGNKIGLYPSGQGAVRGTLHVLNQEYFISAEACKPPLRGSSSINIWSIDTRNQIKRIPVNGEITSMAVSTDTVYCAVGVNNKILLWNLASGQLLTTISYHHEPITKILFWNTTYFVSCGADGLLAVWRLADVISRETGEYYGPSAPNFQTPFFSSSKHSLPITDIFLSPSGNNCRLYTVSADQHCHIFSISTETGKFLFALTYDFVLTSVLCDHLQRTLYVGTSCGRVIIFSLESNRRNLRHVTDENKLFGHAGAVKALSITKEDDLLATGSEDRKLIIWTLSNKQQLHICEMHGHISNLFFYIVKNDFLTPGPPPRTIVNSFERNILGDTNNLEVKLLMKGDVLYDDQITSLENVLLFREGTNGWGRPTNEYKVTAEEDPEADMKDDSETDSDIETVSDIDFNEEPITADYKRIVKLKRQMSTLRSVNRRLKRANKKLYIFGLEQVWNKRTARDINA